MARLTEPLGPAMIDRFTWLCRRERELLRRRR